ncbi:hypothetical protein [Bradyrhizobium tropiciagri]|uniref:hypothetical protein n=1 Tax=Bradyrhizobium tropiciagri TaxID=312253 RepID=UPI00067E0823|nr:hypothetical protein [Bradyrhizobium tropiciagri]
MSSLDQPPPNSSWQPRQSSGCLTSLMLFLGVILLLPGVLCAVMIVTSVEPGRDPYTPVVMLIALGGVVLIALARSRK